MRQTSLQIDIVTLFPGVFTEYLGESIIKRAREKDAVRIGPGAISDAMV